MKDDRNYLRHILDAANCIAEDVAEGEEAFRANRRIRDAVIRQLQVLGEASKKVSPVIQQRYPDLDWRNAARTRDWVVHRYFDIDENLIWEVASTNVPAFREAVAKVLAELDRQ